MHYLFKSFVLFVVLQTVLFATIFRGPYFQKATPLSIVMIFRTKERIKPKIYFGKEWQKLEQVIPATSIKLKVSRELREDKDLLLSLGSLASYQYEVSFDSLEPATKYYYSIYDQETYLAGGNATSSFVTSPKEGVNTPLTFWSLGDSGSGTLNQLAVYQGVLKYLEQQQKEIDLILHVGDMAYSDGKDIEFQKRFFEIYHSSLINKVCWPTFGNHEGHTSSSLFSTGPYYDAFVLPIKGEAGGYPSNTEAYYSFQYGRIHFISLNSYDVPRTASSAMVQWLKNDLKQMKAKAQTNWLVAFWHHASYTKGSHDSDIEPRPKDFRENFIPLLEEAGVDLVLMGHSHIYERSMLMDGAYGTPTIAQGVILNDGDGTQQGDGSYLKSEGLAPHEGTIYLVTGNGGGGMFRRGTMPVMKKTLVKFGSVLIQIQDNVLTGKMIDASGEVADEFSIIKKGKVYPTRVLKPWTAKPFSLITPPPTGAKEIIPKQAIWKYFTKTVAPKGWNQILFQDSNWLSGQAGFGYGDKDDVTVLNDMAGRYRVVYLRHLFQLEETENIEEMGLVINYDDGFVAYLNGVEVLRKGVQKGIQGEIGSESHEATGATYFPLAKFRSLLVKGNNLLAIEGHNVHLNSSDFTLDPYFVIKLKK